MAKKAKQPKAREDIKIDGNVAIWTMRMEGLIHGTYAGQFKFRCVLPPTQRISANAKYRAMLGANPTLAGEHESALAYALTQLEVRVIEAPPFWTESVQKSGEAGDLEDDNIIMAALDAAIASEVMYRESLVKRKEEAIKKSRKAADKLLAEEAVEAEKEENDESEDQTDDNKS